MKGVAAPLASTWLLRQLLGVASWECVEFSSGHSSLGRRLRGCRGCTSSYLRATDWEGARYLVHYWPTDSVPHFFSMIGGFSITVPISRPMGLYASLRHPLRMEVFVVVSSTQHEHDAVPVFLGSLFRHRIAYFAGFQSTLWFHSKCFGVRRLPARISDQQSFFEDCHFVSWCSRLDFPFFLMDLQKRRLSFHTVPAFRAMLSEHQCCRHSASAGLTSLSGAE